jgi:hypothetical protein
VSKYRDDPDNYLVYSNMSASHLKLGEKHKALNAAESCLSLNENFVKVCALVCLRRILGCLCLPRGLCANAPHPVQTRRGLLLTSLVLCANAPHPVQTRRGLLLTFLVQGYFRKIEALRELDWIDEAWDTVYECEQYIATNKEDNELEDLRNKLRKRMQVAVPCVTAAPMCSLLLPKFAL